MNHGPSEPSTLQQEEGVLRHYHLPLPCMCSTPKSGWDMGEGNTVLHAEPKPQLIDSRLHTTFQSPPYNSLATQHTHLAAGHREWHLEGPGRGPHARASHACSCPLPRRVHLDGQRQQNCGWMDRRRGSPQGCTAGCKRTQVCPGALMVAARKGVGHQEPYRWLALASCR